LNISGPYNAQILVLPDGRMKVIECNVRASRSLPFVSKTTGTDFVDICTKIFLNEPYQVPERKVLKHVGVKVPQFSFTRLLGADPLLGVEMASTGEVACFGENLNEAFLKAMMSVHFKLPRKNILISAGSESHKKKLLPYIKKLVDLGYGIYSTPGTYKFLNNEGVKSKCCYFPLQPEHPQAKDLLVNREVDLVINIPSKDKVDQADENINCYVTRRSAVDFNVPLISDPRIAEALINSLSSVNRVTVEPYNYLWDNKTYEPEPLDVSRFVESNIL